MRIAGALGILYALIVPTLGMNQLTLLIGDWHWLVRVAHLLVSGGAMAFVGIMSARYLKLKQAERKDAPQVSALGTVR